MKQTLIETQIFRISPQAITEAVKTENGNLIVEGRLQSAETKNGNGRYYPKSVLEREINKYKSGPIKENRALGELDHPDSSIINLKNVSHNIKDVWWDGNDVIGKIEILPTPSGNILTQLFKNGITVGVSSRGMGSLKPIGETQEVQDDFELLCWDFVSTPSTPGAYVHPIHESLNTFSPIIENKYKKINDLITEILCNSGQCSIL